MQVFLGIGRFVQHGNAVFELDFAEFVIGVLEHLQHRLEGLKAAVKAAAAAGKTGDVRAARHGASLRYKVSFKMRNTPEMPCSRSGLPRIF